MKTIGLLGGMSWESTVGYYQAINKGVKESLGGLHSAKIAMYSVDFSQIEKLQHSGDWEGTAKILISAAKNVQAAGADVLLIIADATAEALVEKGIKTVGLLGTAFTMEQDFYKGRLTNNYGLNVHVPAEIDREIIHNVIYKELCLGKINPSSKVEYLRIIEDLANQGAEAVILGCTEIGLLVNQTDTDVTLLDTTYIHAQKAVEYATQPQV